MTIALNLAGLLFGLFLLVKGSDYFVDAASEIAKRFGISEMLIGLTLVAFATSLPEWVASLLAALRDPSVSNFPAISGFIADLLQLTPPDGQNATDLALGNVIGSNICNIGLVIGVCGLLVKGGLKAKSSFLQREIPLMIIISSLSWFFSFKGKGVASWEGAILFVTFIAVLIHTVRDIAKRELTEADSEEDSEEEDLADASNAKLAGFTIGGLAALLIGSNLLVNGASAIAIAVGISEAVVGITMVAFGTSVPELATSVTAVKRGKHSMLLGGVIGSNTANLAVVLGTVAILVPVEVDPGLIGFQFPVMLGFAMALWVFMLSGSIKRWQSGVLLAGYLVFTASLFFPAIGA